MKDSIKTEEVLICYECSSWKDKSHESVKEVIVDNSPCPHFQPKDEGGQ